MKILILGANSYVGARLYLDLSKKHDTTGTYHSDQLSELFIQLDITNGEAVDELITNLNPDIIVHTANNANGRWCEANPEAAVELNQTSTEAIVEAANKVSATLIYISSFAAINPENVYGKTKRASEDYIQNNCQKWIILRPSLIVGLSPNTTNDRPFNRILKNLDEGTPAEYDNSWQFQPTSLGHISSVIESIIEQAIDQLVIPVACSELTTRYQVAKDILQPFGIVVNAPESSDGSTVFSEDLAMLAAHSLPTLSYGQMVKNIHDELHNRSAYILT